MVDTSRRLDLSGNDVIVNALAFASAGTVGTGGSQGNIVIDVNSVNPTIVAGTSATLTLANIATGMVISTNAGATTLTLDTAANIVAALANTYSGATTTSTSGTTVSFTVSAHGAAGVTLAVGTGGTLASGSTGTIATGTQKIFLLQISNVTSPAYNVYA